MADWIDLHCHWLVGIDDGAPSAEDSLELLRGLRRLGFGEVVATPHMRPGWFDNDAESIRRHFDHQSAELATSGHDLPRLSLGAEHHFTDEVLARIDTGQAQPYRGERAILIEFPEQNMPPGLEHWVGRVRRLGLTPVIAHPERYRSLWEDPEPLERLLDAGAATLLDLGATVGKYGRSAQKAALRFLADGWYTAACSDAHRASDVAIVERALAWVEKQYGAAEVTALCGSGPRAILAGPGLPTTKAQ